MSASRENYVQEALEELRSQRERILKARAALTGRSTTVRSKDRSVAVTVDGRGAVTAIDFVSTKFRRMAPAELGSLLVETIEAARKEAAEQAAETFQPLFPAGVDLRAMLSGKVDFDQMFSDAIKASQEPLPGERSPGEGPVG